MSGPPARTHPIAGAALFNGIHRPGVRGVRRIENGTPAVVVGVDIERGQVELELSEPNRGQRWLLLGAATPARSSLAGIPPVATRRLPDAYHAMRVQAEISGPWIAVLNHPLGGSLPELRELPGALAG